MDTSSGAKFISHDDRVIPAAPLCLVVIDVAREQGADVNKLLRGTGLFENALSEQDRISANQFYALLNNAQKQVKARDFSFQVGQALASSHYVGLFRALSYARDMTQAFRVLSVFLFPLCPLISIGRYRQKHTVFYLFRDGMGKSKAVALAGEIVMACTIALTKKWCGYRLPIHFHFAGTRPRHIANYEMHLGRRLHFEQPFVGFSIEAGTMDTAFSHSDLYLLHASVCHYKKYLPTGQLLPEVIRRMVMRNEHVGISDVAYALSVSPATLKRKLKAHNVTYTSLVDEVRREQVIFLLRICRLSNEQGALKMAITDLTNFRRAVKRWTGNTPSELRGR
ncbi:AraC family transcriptional regulator ligand-binding domain-containing protein [Aestuariibacter sp. A3R04]|uniref:AraC family transcriptional regulator n=1 Tax=Aestuariibacter sp. A3R04 TaxID=2841571 RepID=UPI001C08BDEB|nr:AraC family transcriptional regulator ligand-binding domain-containing protein [Aestuariibacter sp. A3R04]